MRIALIYNPRSGRGRALDAARAFGRGLAALGHETVFREAGAEGGLRSAAEGADGLVIVGGDGTLHHTIAELLPPDQPGFVLPPLYHLPLGTQNLFARELGMTPDPGHLHGLLLAGRPRALDAGLCNGRPFILMCSVGPDSGVLARLHAASSENGRRRPISHRSYIMPMLTELFRLKTPELDVTVDGSPVVERKRGMVVVGNCRRYAMRFNPAIRASMSDGVLDTVFFPARGRASMVGWGIASRLGWHTHFSSLVYRTGTRIDITTAGPTLYQLDGEIFEEPSGRLSISVLAGAVRAWA